MLRGRVNRAWHSIWKVSFVRVSFCWMQRRRVEAFFNVISAQQCMTSELDFAWVNGFQEFLKNRFNAPSCKIFRDWIYAKLACSTLKTMIFESNLSGWGFGTHLPEWMTTLWQAPSLLVNIRLEWKSNGLAQ